MWILVGVCGAVFGLGWALGSAGSPKFTVRGPNNKDSADCEALCNQWDARRNERCNAEKAAKAAKDRVDSITFRLAVLGGLAVAAWVAYWVALGSVVLLPYAPVCLGVAIVLSLLVDYVLGELAAASIDAGAKDGDAQSARNAEAQARALLVEQCKDSTRLGACFARPSPC